MVAIKSIREIKDFASFENFVWDDTKLNNFEKYNLFYGLNGCGKTTLSRFFYFLGEGKICSEGNYKEHFKIVLDNGVEITQFDNNLLKNKICVFNDLFIENYLDFKTVKSKKKITYFSAGKNAKDLINYKNSLERRKKVLQEKVDDLVKEENNIANGKKKIFEKFQDIVDAKGNKQRKFCKHWQKNNLEDKQIYQIVKKGSNSNIVPPSL